ncbi:MAG: ribokinase [Candidatus Hydrogenedentes bacterium]|nr:ribokinase [Candidatus Hydrogenedentota bacterium]
MSTRIVVVGSSNTDMIVRAAKLPKPGETVIGGGFSTAAGGKGANQAVAAARAGGDVTFITCVGDDAFGQSAVLGFVDDGIDVAHILTDPVHASGVALIMVDEAGENCIAVSPGANACLFPGHIADLEALIAGAAVVLAQLEVPVETVSKAAELAVKHGVRFVLNPAPAMALEESLLRRCSLLTPNESEAGCLTGIAVRCKDDAFRAARKLHAAGVGTVLITLGGEGVIVVDDQREMHMPGFAVTPVDTTAAGDCFNGALVVALAEGRSLDDAIRFAQAAAALSVTVIGAQPSLPMRDRIEAFLVGANTSANKV